jgi:outer membrane receptor for ferrienterochelin and colicins
MNRYLYILAIACICVNLYSQSITGTVYSIINSKKEPIEGAIIKWVNTNNGKTTDIKGKFKISAEGITDKRLVVSQVGYLKDTILVSEDTELEIIMMPNILTGEIEVEGEHKSSYFDNRNAKTEIVTSNELVKDACCDLSGCFGRNSSVDVAVTDILTDSKELKVLGLDGVYTQVLVDNMPIINGLNTKYSISSYPGPLIDRIMITKGANSVLQGYENISGIINVLTKDHTNSDRIFLNAFINSMLEKQVNANFTNSFGKKWNSFFTLHSTQRSNRVDENSDGFLDNPLITRYMAFNKWAAGSEKDRSQFTAAGKLWFEDRIGGQKNYDAEKNEGSSTIYGQSVHIKSGDFYTRYNRTLKNENSLKVLLSGSIYDLDSYYGYTKYIAKQNLFNGTLIYEFSLPNENFLKTGLSYKYEMIHENIRFVQQTSKTYHGDYMKKESIPGIFAEHSVNLFDDKASIMTGLRFDYHNTYKAIITPRVLIRYQPAAETVIRTSIGSGFRTIDPFNEYSSLMASSKDIILPAEIKPEKMLNYGVDLIQYYNIGKAAGSINLDLYRTEFYNKFIPDYDSEPGNVIFTNITGKSFSNILQAELTFGYNGLNVKTAYKFVEIKYQQNGEFYDQYMNPKHRLMGTISFSPQNKSWGASAGIQWFGKQRLPNTSSNPVQYQRESESEPFSLVNIQFNKNFNIFEIYAGAENLFNFKQSDPVISADDPFGPYFDTSQIWGPTKGREFYMGFRLKIN